MGKIPYKINPVKATCMKYEGTDYGIQGLNTTCFNICAAYSGTNDIYSMDPQCSKACTDYIEERKKEIFGVGSCDHQVPYRPVFWEEFPHYVPILLRKGEDVNTVKDKCMELCDVYNSNIASQCRDTCVVDFNAIELSDDTPIEKPSEKRVRFQDAPKLESKTENKKSSKGKTLLIFLILLALLITIIMISFFFVVKK